MLDNLSSYSQRLTISQMCALLMRNGIELRRTTIAHYIRIGLLAPPEGLKYGHEHAARLVVIAVLREVYSLDDIAMLLDRASLPMSKAMDVLGAALEGCQPEATDEFVGLLGLMGESCRIKRQALQNIYRGN